MNKELNEIVFWREVIQALKERRDFIIKKESKRYNDEYFENFKDNPFDNFGRVNLAVDMAQKRLKKELEQEK